MSYAISGGQVKYIKTMGRQVFEADDEAYREMLWGVAKVKSCKELKGAMIDRVIGHLEKCLGRRAPEPGDRRLHTRAPVPPRPPEEPRATPGQVLMIRGLWGQFSTAPDQEKALRAWLGRQKWPESPEWLTLYQAQDAIEALKEMVDRTEKRQSGGH